MISPFPYKGSFTDVNNNLVNPGDEVLYGNRFKHHSEQPSPRRGVLIDTLQDGDAEVRFHDTGLIELVKFMNLCKVIK